MDKRSREPRLKRAIIEKIDRNIAMYERGFIVEAEYEDFNFFFDGDTFTAAAGENMAVYIVPCEGYGRMYSCINSDEFKRIYECADGVLSDFYDVRNNSSYYYANYKECMLANGLDYSPTKCHKLKQWEQKNDSLDVEAIADFLSITTGHEYAVTGRHGYCQGDYVEVIYCTEHYNEAYAGFIGDMAMGCGAEFCISDGEDDVYGFYVSDSMAWGGDEFIKELSEQYGEKIDRIEMCDGEIIEAA